MPKDKTMQGTVQQEDSEQFYVGESKTNCMSLISCILNLIAFCLVIPWSIWAYTSSLWPTSEAFNPDVVGWVKVNILVMFILPLVNFLFEIAARCCTKSASADLKQCFVLSEAIFAILSSLFKAIWGVIGAILLAKVESNSTWFTFSILIMDLILLLYIIPFVWGILICLQQCCCPNKQQKKHANKYANLDNPQTVRA